MVALYLATLNDPNLKKKKKSKPLNFILSKTRNMEENRFYYEILPVWFLYFKDFPKLDILGWFALIPWHIYKPPQGIKIYQSF